MTPSATPENYTTLTDVTRNFAKSLTQKFSGISKSGMIYGVRDGWERVIWHVEQGAP